MADEEVATPVVSLDTPASDPVVETKEAPVELEEVIPDVPAEEDPGDDEIDELELGFKKYQVPKSLKSAVEEWRAATTQKEQSVAEMRKTLEAREAEITQRSEATETELDARAQLHGIKTQLAEYEKLSPADWQAAHANDPFGTQQARLYYDTLKEQKAALEETVSKSLTERTQKAQQSFAKRVEETVEFAKKEIPGWKPELTEKIVKYAFDRGVPEDFLQSNWSPQLYRILHDARIGSLALSKQAAAPKTSTTPPRTEPIAPLTTVAAKSASAHRPSLRELADAGRMEEYAAARAAGRTR
jgi:hypothetical protein